MTSFFDSLLKESTIGVTENGAKTYTSTLNPVLDFFALAGGKRNEVSDAVAMFSAAFAKNRVLATVALFYLRDIRGGQGERTIFRECLKYMYNIDRRLFLRIYKLIPAYGRWDDAFEIFRFAIAEDIRDFMFNEEYGIMVLLKKDMDSDTPSLLAKWFPLYNSVSSSTRKLEARIMQNNSGLTEQQLRKIVVSIRKKLNLVERSLSTKSYEDIEYSKIPSRAGMKYRKAFMAHDSVRYAIFMDCVKSGKMTINTSCIYPHDIIHKLRDLEKYPFDFNTMTISNPQLCLEELEVLHTMWDNLPNYITSENSKSICVVDVSGSMTTIEKRGGVEPIDVSVGLGIYMAERCSGYFGGKFITFTDQPRLVEVCGENILEKYKIVMQHIGYNTNILAVFELIRHAIIEHNVPKDECPEVIYIISDMEFDEAQVDYNGGLPAQYTPTVYEEIKERYAAAGIKLPNIVFWNVASRGRNIPVRKDDINVTCVSGLSPTTFTQVVLNRTPEEHMFSVLSSEKYTPVIQALEE